MPEQPFGPYYGTSRDEAVLDQPLKCPYTPISTDIPKSTLPTYPTIPSIFPRESVNLLAFTPKVGTFRFLLPQLANYAAGRPFLDIPHPCPTAPEQLGMILCNKQIPAMREKIESMGLADELTDTSFPIVKWESSMKSGKRRGQGDEDEEEDEFPLDKLYEKMAKIAGYDPSFIIIESLYLLLKSRDRVGDPVAIGAFTDRLHEFCRQYHCTILGTIPVAKSRPGDEYQILAHRIYGSVQWGVSTSCLMLIERYNDVSSFRRIRIEASIGRNEHETRWVDFDMQGRLMLRSQPEPAGMIKRDLLNEIVDVYGWTAEERHSRAEILAMVKLFLEGEDTSISSATVDRWLAKCVENKVLYKEGKTSKAQYWRPKPD